VTTRVKKTKGCKPDYDPKIKNQLKEQQVDEETNLDRGLLGRKGRKEGDTQALKMRLTR